MDHHMHWPCVRLCFSVTFVQHSMPPLLPLSDSFLASMCLSLLSLPPICLGFPCPVISNQSSNVGGSQGSALVSLSSSFQFLILQGRFILMASTVWMVPMALSLPSILLPSSWVLICNTPGAASTWLHYSRPLSCFSTKIYLPLTSKPQVS